MRNYDRIDAVIRPAQQTDIPHLLAMIRELAEYERLSHEVQVSARDLEQWLFGDHKLAEAIIAERENRPIGYAVFFLYYNTFRGKPGMYLEDIYVRDSSRGNGVGEAMLRHIAGIAVQKECTRMEWVVLDWNMPALEFYKHIGATAAAPGWTTYGLADEALRRVAQM